MKSFITRLEVMNWEDVGSCVMEFSRDNRNFINFIREDNFIVCNAIGCIFGGACEDDSGEDEGILPKNCVIKIDVLSLGVRDNQFLEESTRFIRMGSSNKIFKSKLRRNLSTSFEEISSKKLSTPLVKSILQETLRFNHDINNGYDEPVSKIPRKDSNLENLKDLIEEMESQEAATTLNCLLHTWFTSRIFNFLSEEKSDLCFGFSTEDKEIFSKLSNGAIKSFFQIPSSNKKIECKMALPEFKLLANLSVNLTKRLLNPASIFSIVYLDHWISQQPQILRKIVSLIKETELSFIFITPSLPEALDLDGINIWDK